MDVNVDETWSDVESTGVDQFVGLGDGDVGSNGSDLVVEQGDVADGAEVVLGVDDVAAFYNEVRIASAAATAVRKRAMSAARQFIED